MRAKLTLLGALVALLVVSIISVLGAAPGSRSSSADATAHLKDVQGDFVGWVRFEAQRGGVVEVEANVDGVKPPGEFHGFHLHTTGKCDPDAVDPATDEVVPFFSAGGHFNPTSEIHGEHAGDFPVLLVMKNGQAEEKFKTDRFRLDRKSTRLNSSHANISYAVFCL